MKKKIIIFLNYFKIPVDIFFSIILVPIALILKIYRKIGSHKLIFSKKILDVIGIFPLNDHYYEPLFNSKHIKHSLQKDRYLPGIDLNKEDQLKNLSKLDKYKELIELNLNQQSPNYNFDIKNDFFGQADAEIYFQLIRYLKPKNILEIGSGHSTLIALEAIKRNKEVVMKPINGYSGNEVVYLKNFNKNLKTFESRSNFEMASTCLDPNSPCRNKLSNDEDTTNQWRFRFFYKKDGGELNQEFFQAYVEAIKKISDNDYLEKFFSKKNKEIERINSAIYSDYFLIDNTPYDKYGPGLYYFSKKDIFHRAKVLNDKIQPLKNKIKIIDNISEIILENKDPVNHQLTLNNLHCENLSNKSNNFIDYNPNLSIGFNKKFILKKKIIIKNTKCVMAEFVDKNGKKYQKQIIFEPKVIFKKTKNQNFLKYFIEENNVLKLMNKFTTINENLFIPENYLVVIQPGEKISLTNNAFIFSKSPWKVGGESGKVEIKGKKDNFGGGILILNTSIKSVFINTDFSYLSGLEEKRFFDSNYNIFEIKTLYQGNKLNDYSYKMTDSRNSNYNLLDGRILYGSLNLFNTTADIINCSFSKIDSEDGINFISSRYLIKNVKFEELSGDAIDIDFGSGQIINSLFKNIGNDGVDLSGTESFLKNLEFVNISDKIISVGENSNVQILNLKGTNSFVGVASKDGSKTIVQEVEFNDVNIPFASYIKKLSYEAANLDVKKISTLKTFEALGLKDENSEIFIDGESKGNIEEDILNIIYKRLPIKKDDRRI